MELIWQFIVNSILLGIALSADAFSLSVVNGINYPHIKYSKTIQIAGLFALFQALMPMSGWFLTNTVMKYFKILQKLIPWVSQFFLFYLGIKMITDNREGNTIDPTAVGLTIFTLLIQAVATSIDALLVGFTIAPYSLMKALVCSVIIAAVTFVVCFLGVQGGKEIGLKLVGKASVLGGIVLILIAVEHFLKLIFT